MDYLRFRDIKNPLIRKLYPHIRFLFVHSKFHLFFSQWMANLALRLAYHSKFSKWLNMHPCHEFNDKGYLNRYNLYRYVFQKEGLQGEVDYLEFGVAGGSTLRWWIENNRHPKSRFFGFDIFTGLPEDWDKVPKGAFSAQGKPPQIEDRRINYEIGLFQDTLFDFLRRSILDRRTIVHIDCDLYSSALFVLTTLAPRLKKNDIIIFDEFGSIRHPTHEFRAFCDFLSAYKFNYEVIGASSFYHQVALKLV